MRCRFTIVSALGLGFGLLGGCSSAGVVNFFDTETASGAGGSPASAGAASGSSGVPDMAHGGSAGALTTPPTLTGGAAGSVAGGGGAASASGGSPAPDTAGAASSGAAGAASDLPCGPVIDITDERSKAGTELDTEGPVCFLVRDEIAGWGCSNFQGRKVKVNGVEVHCAEVPLPDKLNDGYYFDISAGEHTYASLYWY